MSCITNKNNKIIDLSFYAKNDFGWMNVWKFIIYYPVIILKSTFDGRIRQHPRLIGLSPSALASPVKANITVSSGTKQLMLRLPEISWLTIGTLEGRWWWWEWKPEEEFGADTLNSGMLWSTPPFWKVI